MSQNGRRDAIHEHVANHADEFGMNTGGPSPDHFDSKFVAECARFGVQIIEDFHVIRNEADWAQDDAVHARGVFPAKMMTDVGFKPWL